MRTAILLFTLLTVGCTAEGQSVSSKQYREDFDFFWTTINRYYCYWDKKQTNWNKVKQHYAPLADTVTSNKNFILLLEKVFYELYDHHASLSSNTAESQRLVPSGTDVWAEYRKGRPVITEVRPGFGAEKAGLQAGAEILSFNDTPVETALKSFLPRFLKRKDEEAKNYALRVLLAGTHLGERKITVRHKGKRRDFFPDRPTNYLEKDTYQGAIESRVYDTRIGYIRINNRLWDNGLILLFDSVLQSLSTREALILDLRETPGGGNTTVARSILGRFITADGFYQKHELTSEEREYGVKRSWAEIVSPKPPVYTGRLILLVNHWTGSVGEGITIGFDALRRATIIGTPMARLNGAVYSFTMPHTGIGFNFPAEKLFHINGTPREAFEPASGVNLEGQRYGEDLVLQKALQLLATGK